MSHPPSHEHSDAMSMFAGCLGLSPDEASLAASPVEKPVEYDWFGFHDKNTFEVEEITEKCVVQGVPHYWIKWKGYPESRNTWEPEENLSPYALQLYKAHKKDARAAPPMTAAEALGAADAEGLALLCADNATGFKGVSYSSRKKKPFRAEIGNDKEKTGRVRFGYFPTAEEAALFVARFLRGRDELPGAKAKKIKKKKRLVGAAKKAAAKAVKALARVGAAEATEAAEATKAAEAEGLTLLRSDGATGFKFVHFDPRSAKYKARVRIPVNGDRPSSDVLLGNFDTPEMAALVIARYLKSEEYAAATAPAPTPASEADDALTDLMASVIDDAAVTRAAAEAQLARVVPKRAVRASSAENKVKHKAKARELLARMGLSEEHAEATAPPDNVAAQVLLALGGGQGQL